MEKEIRCVAMRMSGIMERYLTYINRFNGGNSYIKGYTNGERGRGGEEGDEGIHPINRGRWGWLEAWKDERERMSDGGVGGRGRRGRQGERGGYREKEEKERSTLLKHFN
jgi:hypothetical protein